MRVEQLHAITLDTGQMLTGAALEQTAALVEGKVTPRLATLLDSIKDEKKVSLAVADPKLGIISSEIGKSHVHLANRSLQQMPLTNFLNCLLISYPTPQLPICTEPFVTTYHP